MNAVTAYIRQLRKDRHMSRAKVAMLAGVSENTVYRVERNEQEPSGPLLVKLVAAVRGHFDDASQLVLDADADESVGIERARQWLSGSQQSDITQLMQAVPSDQVTEAIAILEELQSDPQKMDRLIGYGQRLREEDPDADVDVVRQGRRG